MKTVDLDQLMGHEKIGASATRQRVRELETLLGRLRGPMCVQVNVEMWEARASSYASDEEKAEMARELAKANSEYHAASTALTSLVEKTRGEAPAAFAAWLDAHETYLASMIERYTAEGGSVAESMIFSYQRDRERWADVRAGTRAFPIEGCWYDPKTNDRYRALFGIDINTLDPTPD